MLGNLLELGSLPMQCMPPQHLSPLSSLRHQRNGLDMFLLHRTDLHLPLVLKTGGKLQHFLCVQLM